MTIERPMFPPRTESVDSFSAQPAIGQPESQTLTSESRKPAKGLSRRAALAGLAVLPAAIPATAAASADPIYAAIGAHRKAAAASCAASAEVKRLYDLADKIAGPREIDVPSMLEPGTTVKASIFPDIEQAIPSAQFPEQYAHYVALLEERCAARFAVTGDTDPIGEEAYAAEWAALDDFAETVPTTLAGLLAMIVYAGECRETDCGAFAGSNCSLIETLATATKALIGRAA
jgi:hypothetical protein